MNTLLKSIRDILLLNRGSKVLLALIGALAPGATPLAKAQYFEEFWLSSLDLDVDWFENWSGEIEAIGGTKIPISVYIEGKWGWKDATGTFTADGQPAIAIGSNGNSNWNDVDVMITIDAPVSFVQLKLDDFDFEVTGGRLYLEWVGNLNDSLGAPSYVETYYAEPGAQMAYFSDENNGSIRHANELTTSQSGIGYAVWENPTGTWNPDLGKTIITFTVSKLSDTTHWVLFDVKLANIPEPSGILLAGAAGATLLLRRKRSVMV